MARNLTSLTIGALDELACLLALRRLLEVGLEQFDNPVSEAEQRVELLLGSYLSQTEPHFEELEIYLEEIKKIIIPPPLVPPLDSRSS